MMVDMGMVASMERHVEQITNCHGLDVRHTLLTQFNRELIGMVRLLHGALVDSEGKLNRTIEFMDGVRDLARNRNPEGATLLDFMAVWNEQYQRRIEVLERQVGELLGKIEGERNAKEARQ